MTFAVHIDANVIQFHCPSCGFELRQTIGLLKAEKRMVCAGCNVGINIDTCGWRRPPRRCTRRYCQGRTKSRSSFSGEHDPEK